MITECDKNSWPLAVIRVTGKVNKDVDFQGFTNAWSMLYVDSSEKQERFRLVLDAREMGKVDIKYLYGMAKFLMHCKQLTETWMEKTAIWVGSSRIKKMLHFVFKFYKPVRPFRIFGREEEAAVFKWVLSDEHGEEVRPVEVLDEEDIQEFVTDESHLINSEEKIENMKKTVSKEGGHHSSGEKQHHHKHHQDKHHKDTHKHNHKHKHEHK